MKNVVDNSKVIISNKDIRYYMEHYKELDAYKNLHESNQGLFDLLFGYLIINGDCQMPNKDIAARLGIQEKTVSNRLYDLEKAHLIKRDRTNTKLADGSFRCEARHIWLDPFTFPEIAVEKKNYKHYAQCEDDFK